MNVNPYESPQGKESEAPVGWLDRLFVWLRGGSRERRDAWCSFCGKHYRETGPLVEGPNCVYICHPCSTLCVQIIEAELERRGESVPQTR